MTLVSAMVLFMNLTNAVGSAAQHRANKAAPLEDKIRKDAGLRTQEAEIADKLARLGWVTRGDDQIVVRRAVEQLKANPLFKRSGECRDVTKDDSGGFCSNFRGEEARLDAALKVEMLEGERKQLRLKMLNNDAPDIADVQLGTLKRLLSRVVDLDDSFLAAGLAGLLSVVVEILGTLVPAAASRHYASNAILHQNESATIPTLGRVERVSSPSSPTLPHNRVNSLSGDAGEDKLTLPAPSPEGAFERWSGEGCRLGGEDHARARSTFLHYTDWCAKRSITPLSERAFSDAMQSSGYVKKKIRGVMHYLNLELVSHSLKVVK
jgi:hypothetical protein